MAGRHRDTAENSAPRRFPIVIPATATALVLLVGAGGYALLSASDQCAGRVPVDVVAAPDIAPVLTGIAARMTGSKQRIGDLCVEVRVSAQPSATVAGVLSGTEAGAGPLPEVWIPDSSVWLDQAREHTEQPAVLPAEAPSIASSPTVIAAPEPVARRLAGSDQGKPGWRTLLRQFDSERPLRVGFPNPTRNSTGLAALLSVGQLTGNSPAARAKQAAVARKLAEGSVDDVNRLFAQLPRAADPATVAASVAALPITEQSVWRYNAADPPVPLAALYPSEGALRMDYPFVALRDAPDPNRTRAAAMFLGELGADEARRDLLSNGFRTPEGRAGAVISPAAGLDPRAPASTPAVEAATVDKALASWQALGQAGRMLTLIDISGSMKEIVPGVGKSRLEVATTSAQHGLGLVGDDSEIGLWVFSSQLVGGNQDFQQLVPPGPLDQPVDGILRRGALTNALTRIQVLPNGSTGLYDSINAVHRVAVQGYAPDKVNSVLVYTDGKNSDPAGGLSLNALLADLKRRSNPQRPVPVFILAFGQDVDLAAAGKIAAATQGRVLQVRSVGQITDLFLQSVGQRTCRPNC